jgi:prophage regulatory protein
MVVRSTANQEVTAMTESIHAATSTILRLKHVKTRTGLSRSTIYQRIKDGTFPAQVSLGPRAVGWLEADIGAWIDLQVRQSRAQRGA